MSTPVLVATISTLGTLLVAIVGLVGTRMARHGRQIAANREDVMVVREQVVNSHGTNLRDDLDDLRDLVLSGFQNLTEMVHDVRVDLAWERRERRDLAERLTGEKT